MIRASSRSSDIAARFGGEEFALIVPGPAEEALEAAERIRAAVAKVTILVAGGESVGTTISAGVSDFQNGSGDLGERHARSGRQGALPLEGGRSRPGQPLRPRASLGRRVVRPVRPL